MKPVLIILFSLISLGLNAQTARDLFIAMPDSLLPTLTKNNRLDCLDFLASGMKAMVTNRLGGQSQMTHLSDTYVRIQLSPKSEWQMKVLPSPSDTAGIVICTIATVSAPASDSRLCFYDAVWRPLPRERFLPHVPAVRDFLLPLPDSARTYRQLDARRAADISFVRADFAEGNDSLRFTLDTPRYMPKEAASELKSYVRRRLVCAWSPRGFRLE